MLKPSDKIIKAKNKKQWINASAIISFILVLIGAATLILIQKPIQESQDLRQQASVSNGQVQMSFNPANNTTLRLAEEAQIGYQVTTNSVQVDGIQLVFNVVTNTLGAAPEFILTDTTNLQIAYQQAEQVTDGYLVSIILISSQIASPVSYASPTSIGYLAFTPQSTGSIIINFDVENSLATVFNSNPTQDQLNNIDTLSYNVLEGFNPTPSPSPSLSVSPSPSASPNPSATATASPSPSPSPSATATASPSPSPSALVSPTPAVSPSPAATNDPGAGTGGNETVSCNESCSSNNECEANHRCYNNQCRLVTNVSSTSCDSPSDAGLNKSCNEYCADNRECGAGFSCYFNRCRNPLNLDSISCAAPSQQVAAATVASCNQGCATHKDCAANLLCNPTSNTCRLATNPSSTSCIPATQPTVSNIYSGSKGGTKGGTNNGGTTGSNTNTGSSNSNTASPTVSANPSASPASGQTGTEDEDILPIKDQTALGALVSYFQEQLAQRNISLPLFLIILGIILLVLVFIVSMILRLIGGSRHQSPIINPVGSARDVKKDTQYENKLAERINTLQQNQSPTQTTTAQNTPVSSPQPLPTNRPPVGSANVPSAPSPLAPPPQAATSRPTSTISQSPQPSGSNMMDRLKNKGISTPSDSDSTNT